MNKVMNYTEQDKQFYPTPKSFLERIKSDFWQEIKSLGSVIKVLEPSAGKGDIADYVKSWSKRYTYEQHCKVDCIEIDKTLQATLKGKGYTVVYDDFLSFNTFTRYDLIFMNPPFENGDKHLLKAISMQEKYGGRVLCILNAETLRNPYSNTRKELTAKLEKLNAKIKYYQDAFSSYDSERISNVETAVIWVDVLAPESVYNSKVFEELDKAKEIHINTESEQSAEQNELVKMGLDWITAYVEQYNEQIESTIKFFQEYLAFENEYKQRYSNLLKDSYLEPFDLVLYGDKYNDMNKYIEITRRLYWKALFDNPKFSARLTNKLQNELHSRLDDFANYDFTEHNILVLMEENMNATIKGIEQAILDLFDDFTKYAQYDGCDNIHYYNGWKTNKAHKLNSKIIIPFYCAWEKKTNYAWHGTGYGGYCTHNGYYYELNSREAVYKLSDMSKTLNYLANGVSDLENIDNLAQIIESEFKRENAKNIETTHFILTFYKKGTCHIKFRNQDLLDKFNLFASQRKGWLPPSYGKKAYSEMNEEEQELVKEFSGDEQAYNKIFENQNLYLVENRELLQLQG